MAKKNQTNLLQKLISLIMRHSILVLIVIAAITAVLGYEAKKIRIDANIFSIGVDLEGYPYVKTPTEIPTKVIDLDGIEEIDFIPNKGEVVTIPYRDNSGLVNDISSYIAQYKEVPELHNIDFSGEDPDEEYDDSYVVVFTSDKMFTPEVLNAIYSVRDHLFSRWDIGTCLSPFDFVTVEKRGSRLALVPMSPISDGEVWDEESVEVFKSRVLNDSVAKDYLYSGDGSTFMLIFQARNLNAESLKELDSVVNPLRQYGIVALNGGEILTNAIMKYLNRDLVLLFVLCLIVILITFYFSFRSLRSVIIPASMSLIGIVWTLGVMAIVGYDLTLVTILTPCLVLTLGSSYSIHLISEYYEAIARNEKDILDYHFAKITKTIFLAMITTVCGFLSFLVCRTVVFREFGITVAIGVTFCAILSLTYLPAILVHVRNPRAKQMKTYSDGYLSKFVYWSSKTVVRSWKLFCILFVLIFALFMYSKDKIDFDSNYMNYLPRHDQAVIDTYHFARTLGGINPYYVVLRAPEGEKGYFYRPDVLKDVYAFECAIQAADPDIVTIVSFSQYVNFLNNIYSGAQGIPDNAGLINYLSRILLMIRNNINTEALDDIMNEDGTRMDLFIRNYDAKLGDLQNAGSARRIEKTINYFRYMLPEDCESRISSGASDSMRSIDIMYQDQSIATFVSLLMIFIIGAITFLSPMNGIMTLVPVLSGVMFNYIFLFLLHIPFDMVTIGFSSIAVGAGVDDAMHFLIRLKNNRRERPELSEMELVELNIRETGRAIILTTLSIDMGLVMLTFASFNPIRYFGLLLIVSLTASMLSTIFILPSILILKDKLLRRRKG